MSSYKEKITEIRDIYDEGERTWMKFEFHLRELIAMVREDTLEEAIAQAIREKGKK